MKFFAYTEADDEGVHLFRLIFADNIEAAARELISNEVSLSEGYPTPTEFLQFLKSDSNYIDGDSREKGVLWELTTDEILVCQ